MLIIAYTQNRHTLTTRDVKEALSDCEFYKKKAWWSVAVASSVLSLLFTTLTFEHSQHQIPNRSTLKTSIAPSIPHSSPSLSREENRS
jgi:hypothetical protein